jgi:hypothetical protein
MRRLEAALVSGQSLAKLDENLQLTFGAIARIHGDLGYVGPILQAALDGLRPPPGDAPR